MEWSAYPCERRRLVLNQPSLLKTHLLTQALEQRTALAISALPVPLFPLGFSASKPITGAESLAYWGSLRLSLEGVRHLSGLIH